MMSRKQAIRMDIRLPGWFSFPQQVYIDNKLALENLLEVCNGTRPCFMRPHVYTDMDTVLYDCISNDFDSKATLTFPHNDISLLKHFCEEHNIDYNIIFTAGKGFHLMEGIKEIKIDLRDEDYKNDIKTKVANIQLSLQSHLGLKTLDKNTIGKIKQPYRIPTTTYVNRSGERNGLFCRYLTPEEFESGISNIKKLAEEPGIIPNPPKQNLTIDEFIECIPNYTIKRRYRKREDYEKFIKRTSKRLPSANVLFPCMKKALNQEKPPHKARMEITCWLKMMSYTDDSIVTFFNSISWQGFDINETADQVRTIHPRRPCCEDMQMLFGDKICANCPMNKKRNGNGRTNS